MRSKNSTLITSHSRTSKLCSTCDFWAGTRQLQPAGAVEFHPYSKGCCQGGGVPYASMAALASCTKWQLWPGRAGFVSAIGCK